LSSIVAIDLTDLDNRLSDSATTYSQLASASSIAAEVSDALSSCPSDTYIIISQPGVSASDFAHSKSSPNLRQYLNKTNGVQESWIIPELAGSLDVASIEKQVEERCKADVLRIDATSTSFQREKTLKPGSPLTFILAGAIPNDGVFPRIVHVRFPALPLGHQRNAKLEEHDSFLHAVISEIGGNDYTVVYATTQAEDGHRQHVYEAGADYEMDDHMQSILHTDMKRDLSSGHSLQSNSSNLGLFDKYEFLSPGIFMGLFISIILFLILYVGISAVASLQVSYFAFSKEMGPAQQKKQ
jgi:hypothetical protein